VKFLIVPIGFGISLSVAILWAEILPIVGLLIGRIVMDCSPDFRHYLQTTELY
jgi:hypothetical protein